MPQSVKTVLKLIFSISLCAIFLWKAFENADWEILWSTIQSANPGWIILSALFVILSCIPRAWRWQTLMAPITDSHSLWRTFVAVLIGYAGNNVFPRAGEVARVVAIRRGRNLPMSGLLATVLVERVLDMITLLLFFGGILFAYRSRIAAVFPQLERIGLIAFIVSAIFLASFLILPMYGSKALTLIEKVLGKVSRKLATHIVDILKSILLGVGSIRSTKAYVGIVISTVVMNGCYLLSIYLPFRSFGFPDQYGLDLASAFVVMVIATVGIIIPTPGGAGTYHFFCSQALQHLYGVHPSEALAFATVVHGLAYFGLLIAGGPGLLRLFWSKAGHSVKADGDKT